MKKLFSGPVNILLFVLFAVGLFLSAGCVQAQQTNACYMACQPNGVKSVNWLGECVCNVPAGKAQ